MIAPAARRRSDQRLADRDPVGARGEDLAFRRFADAVDHRERAKWPGVRRSAGPGSGISAAIFWR